MGIHEDVEKVQKKIEETSLSMELLTTQNELNAKKDKRNFIIIMTLIILLSVETIFMFYTLNDIGTYEETTQEVSQENDNGNNNFIGNDGVINNGKAND